MSTSEQTAKIDLARQALNAARAMARKQGTATTAKQRHRTRAASHRHDRREPTGLRWVLLQLQSEHGWDTEGRGGEILTHWVSLVGPVIAAHLEAVAYDTDLRLLEIRPDSKAWSIQADLIKAGLLLKLNEALGPGSVRTITVLGVGDGLPTPIRSVAEGFPQVRLRRSW